MTDIVVVVLNYKTPELAVRAAQSAADAMDEFGGVILLVDNASPDNSFKTMSDLVAEVTWSTHLDVQVLQSGRNSGYGAGNNFGIRAGLKICPSAEFVYILNPDAKAERDTIKALVDHVQRNPKVAIAGSWIYGEDGEDHCSAFRFPGLASEFESTIKFGPVTRLLKKYVLPLHVPERSGPVGWVSGASMLARTSLFKEVGLFDEQFFLYFEETDLCMRAHSAGNEVHFVRESRVCHIGSVSTGMGTWTRTPSYWYQSRWYYFSKTYGRFYAIAATALNVLGTTLWRVRRIIEGKPITGAKRFLRDLVAHDIRAFWRPTPDASVGAINRPPVPPLQTSVD
ncbi:glycosyltransferase family 2 protein [Marivita sp. XM-24bin2]|mgnify:CR=1 FL=1|jgi:GT2 family glycosyltransferase|uniref:glycosyltransferase family 2 protein n=1 Tax=unclassified Marivita TaxID=2632480 RepID=UPI000D79A0F5|nr:glycosyltransferase family 2 protein [Marivita sp. XM-24bin2]MCR9108299.1 glycosyltransferase family 2 protein [Paracoccaceae bacterium]PWL36260.1 MAG: glycosyl transferase [Marivita sp. XM-24bin2]